MNDGGPAFPGLYREELPSGGSMPVHRHGMFLRDYFAGQALAAFPLITKVYGAGSDEVENAAVAAYVYADAMLRVRTQKL